MKHSILALCLTAVAALAACGNDDTATPGQPGSVDVVFNMNVDGVPLQVGNSATTYTTPAGTKYGISHLRFVLSDVKLHTDAGEDVALAAVHYYDFDDAATRTIHATVPHENYTGISLRFGMTTAANVRGNYASVIPDVMIWPPSLGADLGYHYMQLEGNYEKTPGGATGGYTTHTGGRHLDGTNIDFPGEVDATAYDFSFSIDIPFTPAHIHEGGHGLVVVGFNLNGWYMDHTPADGIDTQYDFTSLSSQMIMGDLDAQGRLQSNGPGCFTASMESHGGSD